MGHVLQVDKSSPIPLYYQLADLIKEQIQTGILPPGARLSPERELSKATGVSRMTIRQAVAYLVKEGVLSVKQGVGTFVTEPKLVYDALHLQGFTEAIVRQGGNPSSQVLEQAQVQPAVRVAAGLGLHEGETVNKIVRLRLSDDLPLLLETSFIPCALCPDLFAADLTATSLYGLLEHRYGLRLQRAHQTIEATAANEHEAGLFALPPGAAVLLVEGVTYLDSGRPAEYFKAIYRGDRLKLELESRRDFVEHVVAAPRVSLLIR